MTHSYAILLQSEQTAREMAWGDCAQWHDHATPAHSEPNTKDWHKVSYHVAHPCHNTWVLQKEPEVHLFCSISSTFFLLFFLQSAHAHSILISPSLKSSTKTSTFLSISLVFFILNLFPLEFLLKALQFSFPTHSLSFCETLTTIAEVKSDTKKNLNLNPKYIAHLTAPAHNEHFWE